MCSFYVRELISGEWEYKVFPNCETKSTCDFIIYFHSLQFELEYDDFGEVISPKVDERDEYFYQLKYTDGTSIVIETFKVAKLVTKLLFANVPVEDIPKLMFQQKWSCRSINKEYKLLPFLEY